MEFNVLSAVGVPNNGVISIRAGGTRRQVALASLDKPLKFPCKPEDISNVKVDVLNPIGSARLPFDPASLKYTLELDPVSNHQGKVLEDKNNMEVCFEVRRVDNLDSSLLGDIEQREDDSNAYRHRKEVEAHGYLEEHGLVSFMQYLLLGLMQDKPADPYVFLRKQIDMKHSQAEASRGTSKVSCYPASNGYPSAPQSQVGSKAAQPPRAPGRPSSSVSGSLARQAANQVLEVPSLTAGSHISEHEDKDLSNLLVKLSPRAASSVPPEDIVDLERQAIEAVQRTRQENAALRQTAEQLKSEYNMLMRESSDLNVLKVKKATGRANGELTPFSKYYTNNIISEPRDDFLTRLHWQFPSQHDKGDAPGLKGRPSRRADSATLAAWKEIEKMQEELAVLARENAKLVAELAHMREMMELVRGDIKDMIASLDLNAGTQ